jgi:hypothetical protein
LTRFLHANRSLENAVDIRSRHFAVALLIVPHPVLPERDGPGIPGYTTQAARCELGACDQRVDEPSIGDNHDTHVIACVRSMKTVIETGL